VVLAVTALAGVAAISLLLVARNPNSSATASVGLGRATVLDRREAAAASVVATGDRRLFTSFDLGRNWTALPSTVRPLAFTNGGRLFGWASDGVALSRDGGATWVPFAASTPSTVEPRSAVAFGESLVLGGRTGLLRADSGGVPIVLLSGDVLALSIGGTADATDIAAVVLASDGSLEVIASRDGTTIERTSLVEAVGLPLPPLTASIAVASDQIVVALGDGQTVTLIRVAEDGR